MRNVCPVVRLSLSASLSCCICLIARLFFMSLCVSVRSTVYHLLPRHRSVRSNLCIDVPACTYILFRLSDYLSLSLSACLFVLLCQYVCICSYIFKYAALSVCMRFSSRRICFCRSICQPVCLPACLSVGRSASPACSSPSFSDVRACPPCLRAGSPPVDRMPSEEKKSLSINFHSTHP